MRGWTRITTCFCQNVLEGSRNLTKQKTTTKTDDETKARDDEDGRRNEGQGHEEAPDYSDDDATLARRHLVAAASL